MLILSDIFYQYSQSFSFLSKNFPKKYKVTKEILKATEKKKRADNEDNNSALSGYTAKYFAKSLHSYFVEYAVVILTLCKGISSRIKILYTFYRIQITLNYILFLMSYFLLILLFG